MHRRYVEKVLWRVRFLAAKALRVNKLSMGARGFPHHGHDFCRSGAGMEVLRWRRRLLHRGGECLPCRAWFVGLVRWFRKLHGGRIWIDLWREIQGWIGSGLVFWWMHDWLVFRILYFCVFFLFHSFIIHIKLSLDEISLSSQKKKRKRERPRIGTLFHFQPRKKSRISSMIFDDE